MHLRDKQFSIRRIYKRIYFPKLNTESIGAKEGWNGFPFAF